MIHHQHKVIFVHIPRTGGSSIEAALGIKSKLTNNFTFECFEGKHGTASEYKKEWPQWPYFFKFSFVRNPWDRIASNYEFMKVHPLSPLYKIELSFKQWLYNKDSSWGHFLDKQNKGYSYFLDQELNFIGKYENLQSDWDFICRSININSLLPHINKTQRKQYTEYYDDETRQIVAEKYRKDIDDFSYKFGE